MKITKLVPWLVKAAGTYWGEYFFVEVRTDEGVTGWGEITTTTKIANRAVAGIIRELNELLVGEDPSQIERLWHKTFRSFTYTGSRGATTNVISGIDIALWDIRGKVLDQPIYQLLGGKVRDDILLYTHPNSRNFGTDEGVVKETRAIIDSGHTALKFDPFPHVNRIGAADDIYLDGGMSKQGEKIAAKLNCPYSGDRRIRRRNPDRRARTLQCRRIRLCRSLEDAGQIDWFEERVPVESYHALHQVREKVNAHISVGERLHTRWEILPILENHLTDYLMPDVTWTGGITELKKIATLAEAFYIPVSPHDASGPINVVAGAHVMMSTPNFYRLETSRWDLSNYNDFITAPLDNSDGRLKVPPRPGLGIEMNMDFLRGNVVDGFGGT